MKITTYTRTDEEYERWDCRESLQIYVDGKPVFRASDGEPEDSNLSRDFNDCFKIPDLMRLAYEAGVRGEDLSIENLKGEQ
jgi:hypothetical protein